MQKQDIQEFFEGTATSRAKWKRRNSYYHRLLQKYFSLIIPPDSRVIEIGCGPGDLLHAVKPSYGVGIDFAPTIIEEAKIKYPELHFFVEDAEDLKTDETFDYVIMSDLASCLWDIQKAFRNIRRLCHPQTRIVISNISYLWEPIMILGENLGLKLAQPKPNWLSTADLESLLDHEGFQLITTQRKILFPKYIPGISWFFNQFLGNLPLVNHLDLVNLLVARPIFTECSEYSVSVIIPARNEFGNIENAIRRIPPFGHSQEVVFVEGHSEDQTWEEILRVQKAYPEKTIRATRQTGNGKGNAVREGFDLAQGDILMILDADLTTPPEDLDKFYRALQQNKGEFINGCRLVYPLEKESMRTLNFLANKFFGWFFSYLLGQRLKDTLCGTKVLFKRDYHAIQNNRSYFGDFDPFGDFDLLFGAAKLNLKISEVIVRYKEREYGSTQISRFRHGWLLVKMSLFAARKIRFR